MKMYTFPVGVTFGDGDSEDCFIDHELSDDQVAFILRLQEEEGLDPDEIDMSDYPELEETWSEIYKEAKADTAASCDENDWFADDEEAESSLDAYSYTVRIPEELERWHEE